MSCHMYILHHPYASHSCILYTASHSLPSLHSHWVSTPIYSSQGSLTRNISQYIWDLYPTTYFISRFLNPPNIQGSLSHFISWGLNPIALHIGIFYPTSHFIPGSAPLSYHEIFISMHIPILPSIASLHSSNPTNTSSYP